MDPATIIAAGAQLAGALGAGTLNVSGSRKAVKTAINYDREQKKVAYIRQQEMYNRMLQDSMPKQQIKWQREAGLNPALMYESSGFAGASGGMANVAAGGNVGVPNMNAYSAPDMSILEKGLSKRAQLERKMLERQNELLESESLAKRAETLERLGWGKDKILKEIDKMRMEQEGIQATIEETKTNTTLKKAQEESIKVQTSIDNLNKEILEATKKTNIKKIEQESDILKKQIDVLAEELKKAKRENKIGDETYNEQAQNVIQSLQLLKNQAQREGLAYIDDYNRTKSNAISYDLQNEINERNIETERGKNSTKAGKRAIQIIDELAKYAGLVFQGIGTMKSSKTK